MQQALDTLESAATADSARQVELARQDAALTEEYKVLLDLYLKLEQ